jgi:hypothetical protein
MDGGGSFSFLTPKIFFIFFLFFFYREIEGFVDFDSVLAKPKQMKEGFFFFFFFVKTRNGRLIPLFRRRKGYGLLF